MVVVNIPGCRQPPSLVKGRWHLEASIPAQCDQVKCHMSHQHILGLRITS